ncbi:hypothetical protein JB92DRAFT_2915175 [Gautieria morchelliformis]|nr:hypothetical protein JB92DRAFT_2915175 [Gautieria morchelliformis]
MNWLSGKPLRTRSLIWPSGETFDSYGWVREGTSVMDGVILYWFAFTADNDHRTTVYVADTRQNRGLPSIVINRVAELDFAAHGVVLVGDGFASAQWLWV